MTIWALDLDGVLWTGSLPIPGAAAAVADLLAAGHDVAFVTNNSFATIADQERKLAGMGIDAPGRFLSSAMAGATLVEPGERVLILGGAGIHEAVSERGAVVASLDEPLDGPVDAVLVGLDWRLSYDRLRRASEAIAAGARFIATNADATYPTESGLAPGAGAVVAAVAAATERTPIVAGKPHATMAALVHERYGHDGVMVGDRLDTDGAFAVTLGYRFALVLSGVTGRADLPVDPMPDLVADDLAGVVRRALLGG